MTYRHILAGCLFAVGCVIASPGQSDEPKTKLSVPDDAAQTKSLAEVKSVLADDYTKLSKPELSQKLLQLGRDTENDPSRRYVLFLEAAKAAIGAGDGAEIAEAIDEIAENYQGVNAIEMKTKGLEHAAKVVPKDAAEPLVLFLLSYTGTVIEQDNYDAAERLIVAALSAARQARNADLLHYARHRQKEIANLRKEYAKISDALTLLNKEPTDPEANLIAGKYYALVVGNWDKGVTMLALGNDPDLKAAAALELAQPSETDKQVGLADKWWGLSVKATGLSATHLRERSAYWYEKAMPGVQDDFVKAKLKKRLESMPKVSDVKAMVKKRLESGGDIRPVITNSIGMKLKLIPAGNFIMGSPPNEEGRNQIFRQTEDAVIDPTTVEQQHRVWITRAFYMGIYTVTQSEYERITGGNPSFFSATGGGKDKVADQDTSRFPVENVSWNDAQEFCRELSQKEGKRYRLPTETEWEYACRAGTTTPFNFGNALNGSEANCNGNYPYGTSTKGAWLERTTKVGSYRPNAIGLYDMHGNVGEWCSDWFETDYYKNSSAKDPKGPATGSDRVFRGGGWYRRALFCRSANRFNFGPTSHNYSVGFRVVLER